MSRVFARTVLLLATLFMVGTAQSAITYVASSLDNVGAGGANNVPLSLPTGTLAGDLLIAQIALRSSSATVTAPSGWTALRQDVSGDVVQAVYYKVATASEPTSYTFTFNASYRLSAALAAFRGVDGSAPIITHAAQTAASATATAPSVNTAVDNTMLLALFAVNNGNATFTTASGMTELVDWAGKAGPNGPAIALDDELRPTAGATGTRTSTASVGTNTIGVAIVLRPGGLDHIQIEHTGSGVTCAPSNITVKACADAACTTLSASAVTASLVPAGGWSFNPVTFTGSTTLTLSVTTPSTVTLGTSAVSPAPTNATQCYVGATATCALTFADTGFLFSTIPTQTAGVNSGTLSIQAVRKSDNSAACTGVFNGNVSIEMASQCVNPTTCAGKTVTINATAIANNPASGITSYTPVTLNFGANSTATFTLNYADVGAMSLSARYALGGGGTMSGTSNTFVVKPFGFTVTNIQRTSDGFANPGAGSASGPVFITSGSDFTATVTAIAQGGTATPNFGRETTPEGVLLQPALVAPVGGSSGTLANATLAGGAFSSGVASPTNLSWSEVGIITLTPRVADGDYLGAGDVVGTTTGNIGRFYPHHFVATGVLSNRSDLSCTPASSFTYMGEPMGLALTLTAQNAANGVTTNYASGSVLAPGFAKLDPATAGWLTLGANGSVGVGAVDGSNYLTSRLALSGTPSGSWVAGIGSLSANIALNRGASVDGPFDNLQVGVAPQDTDGVTLLAGALDLNADTTAGNERKLIGTTKVRYGRARLANAHGSELLALPVPLTLQYFNGAGWVTHASDSCTPFTIPLAGTTCSAASCTWGDVLLTKVTLDANKTNVTMTSNPVLSGASALNLSAPNASGAEDLTLTVPTWLQYNWTGTVGNPKARATFGIYKNVNEFIYQRESY